MLARFYSDAGQRGKALEVLTSAQASERTSFELLEALGAAQLAVGDKQKALATYARLASLQPKVATVHYRLASAQALNDDPVGAARSLRRALELQPDYSDAKLALVGVEIRNKRYADATAIARQLQKQDRRSPTGFVLEGDVLMSEQKFLAAAKLYETAYELAPSGAAAMKLHAAYTRGKKPDEADKRLAQWLEKSPNDVVARRFAADTALKTGRYANAIEQYNRLRQDEPANVEVLNNLAMAYWLAKDPRAVAAAERAYKIAPNNPDVADTLGWLLIQQGDGARGMDVLQRVVSEYPDKPTLVYHLAYGWNKMGETVKARNELERLLSGEASFPERGDAESLLRQLK
jgi:putative PEP-CTERM system TPR-repeat lipoprotein